MSLHNASKRDWAAFDNDQGSPLAEPICDGCDGPLVGGYCASCDEPAAGMVEAKAAAAIHWKNKARAA